MQLNTPYIIKKTINIVSVFAPFEVWKVFHGARGAKNSRKKTWLYWYWQGLHERIVKASHSKKWTWRSNWPVKVACRTTKYAVEKCDNFNIRHQAAERMHLTKNSWNNWMCLFYYSLLLLLLLLLMWSHQCWIWTRPPSMVSQPLVINVYILKTVDNHHEVWLNIENYQHIGHHWFW